MAAKIPPHAESVLVALVAGTYKGGNDLRAIDALERRGLVRVVSRDATLNDAMGHARAGRGIEVTPDGLAAVEGSPKRMADVAFLRATYPQVKQ